MKWLVGAFLAVSLPAAYAVPIFITIAFTGSGSVGGAGFATQNVTVTAIADTANVSFPLGSSRPAYAPPNSLTIQIPGFGTGTATNPSVVVITNAESQGLGSFSFNVEPFVYLALTNAAFSTWNLTTPIGPVMLSGDSTQGFVQLDNNDVWGVDGIGTSIGNVKITYAENVVVTASLAVPGPVTVFSPAQGATGVSPTTALTWTAVPGAASYDVYFGTSTPPPFVANTAATSYTPPALNLNTTYYWYLVSKNGAGSTPSAIWSFTTAVSSLHPSFFTGEVSLAGRSLLPAIPEWQYLRILQLSVLPSSVPLRSRVRIFPRRQRWRQRRVLLRLRLGPLALYQPVLCVPLSVRLHPAGGALLLSRHRQPGSLHH